MPTPQPVIFQEWIDLSSNNYDPRSRKPGVDWPHLDPVIRGAIVKLTEGVSFIDKRAALFCAGARDAGKILGGYHYLRVRHGRPQDARQQAHDFAEVFTRDRCEFGELDVELRENEAATGSEVHEAVLEFQDELVAILDPKMLLYTSKGEWKAWGLEHAADLGRWPLSLAAYTQSLTPQVPGPWTDWLLHQYTGTGTVDGVDGQVDRYRSRGSLDEWKAAMGMPFAPLSELDVPRPA